MKSVTTTITCDCCTVDLSDKGRIIVEGEYLLVGLFPGAHHFCGIKCMKEFIECLPVQKTSDLTRE